MALFRFRSGDFGELEGIISTLEQNRYCFKIVVSTLTSVQIFTKLSLQPWATSSFQKQMYFFIYINQGDFYVPLNILKTITFQES